MRRRLEGSQRGSFELKGSNFFVRPEKGKLTNRAWQADRKLLDREHRALCQAVAVTLGGRPSRKQLPGIYGVAFHACVPRGPNSLFTAFTRRE